MRAVIQQIPKNLMLFLLIWGNLTSCNASSIEHLKSYEQAQLELPTGELIKVYVAKSDSQQRKGLSGVKAKDFVGNVGMLFPEKEMRMRQFWMPETHFNLDIIFMNEDYYILDIHRNLQHSPKKPTEGNATYSKAVFSQHVLELKAGSELANKVKPGMVLKFKKLK